jgi:signal transduction protein with GAF and PtsI domain
MDNLNEQIGSLLRKASDRDTALKNALDRVLTNFQSETGTIHLLEGEKQLLYLAAQVGLPPQLLEVVKTIPVGKGIAGQTVAQNKPVTICNLQTDSSGVAKPGAKQTGVGGALCVPMRKAGRIVGTLGIGTMRPHQYTAEEMEQLEDIADSIAKLIEMKNEE